MKPLYIGLDVGTQGTKCLILDMRSNNNKIVGRGSASYGVISERPGQAEQHPSTWIDACKASLQQALQHCDASLVGGVAVSGQQHGLVVLDAEGQVIRPAKLWCDLESAAEASELSAAFGTTIVPSFTATKLLWLKRHDPESYGRIAHVLLPHDYINYWLTGKLCMEASDASGTGLFDPVARQWDFERIKAVDPNLREWLPETLLRPDETIGLLREDVALELGLPEVIKVGPGGGDNAMSALGCGAVDEGVWVLSLGTSGTLFGPARRPILDESGAICAFCDATGQALPLLCTVNCTGATEEVRAMFGMSHAALEELAAAEPPGSCGVTMLPYLQGERTPNWPHASGALLGLRPGLLRPGLLYRAAMEGATFSLLSGLRKMQAHGVQAKQLRLVGGGSKSALWRRIVADSFQLPLLFPAETEAAALGAALQAGAVANGKTVREFLTENAPKLEEASLQPDPAVAEAYEAAFQRFIELGQTLFAEKD